MAAEATYKKVDAATFMKNAEMTRKLRTGGGDFWKPTVGKSGSPVRNVIRILPPHQNMADVFVISLKHFSLGPNEDKTVSCTGRIIVDGDELKVVDNEDCPACQRVKQMFATAKSESNPDNAKKIRETASRKGYKFRFHANIVDMLKPESGVQKYEFGTDVNKDLGSCFLDDDGAFRDISDVSTGRDIILMVDKKPNTDFNQYNIKPKETPSALKDMKWLGDIEDLSVHGRRGTVAEVQAALDGKDAPKTASTSASPKAETSKPDAPKGRTLVAPKSETKSEAPAGKRIVKKPVADAPVDPFAEARKLAADAGFTPVEITPDDVKGVEGPDCYSPRLIAAGDELYKDSQIADVNDANCRKCRLFLSCASAKLVAMAA